MEEQQQEVTSTGPPVAAAETGPRKVAVIAVHGVGKHAAGETQNAMADLLLSLPAGAYPARRKYSSTVATDLHIPLQPLKTGRPRRMKSKAKPFYKRSIFAEQSADFAYELPDEAGVPPEVGEVSTEYTELLLSKYKGGEDSNQYTTRRLETVSRDGVEVHIYEVLWSDLAKPDNGVVSFFMGLFQLLLHLGSLSRLALDAGAAETPWPLWRAFRLCHRYAVRMLQIFIPVLELLLFIAITSCFSSIAEPTSDKIAVPLLLGGVGMHVPLFWLVIRGRWKPVLGWKAWSAMALLPGALGSGLALLMVYGVPRIHWHGLGINGATALLWWAVVGGSFLAWILSTYEEVRPGVMGTGLVMGVLGFVLFGWMLHAAGPANVTLASFWTAEILLLLVRLSWSVLIGLAIGSVLLGRLADWRGWKPLGPEATAAARQQRAEQKARAAAARRTSRLALGMPAVLFVVVTLLLWDGFTHLSEKTVRDPLFTPQTTAMHLPGLLCQLNLQRSHLLPIVPIFSATQKPPAACGRQADLEQLRNFHAAPRPAVPGAVAPQTPPPPTNDDYVGNMLAWSAGYQLPLTLILLGLAGFLMVWWALPSVMTETFPPRYAHKPPRWSTDAASLRMGNWLSAGLDATRVVSWLMWSSIFLMPVLFLLAELILLNPGLMGLTASSKLYHDLDYAVKQLTVSTKVLVISYGALATVILATLAKGGQTVLSILLDVDTYMRSSPERMTPRAKIFERYISTLRFVDTQQYDRVVIAAHSLGALISGDLLHFVQAKRSGNGPQSDLDRIPANTSLFTFGNPLRQLLNRFFPYLYDWVRAVPDNAVDSLPLPAPAAVPALPPEQRPLPSELGVTHWASAYRSGDYVGRSLWLDGWFWRKRTGMGLQGLEIVRSASGDRAEACIGAGAHTHYMDDTAPEIAVMLDRLIHTGRV